MATGRRNKITQQIGEYLVACELARRGLLVATFSGNVPDFDIIAADANGHSIPIQVKTIRSGEWQFNNAGKFIEVRFEDKKLCILVLATEYGKDRFYILEWEQLRDIVVSSYSAWLAAKDGVRPRNYESLHCSVSPEQLAEFENQWDKITERL